MSNNQLIFKTNRLEIKKMKHSDLDHFITLLTSPEIIQLIPQSAKSKDELIKMFEQFTDYSEAPEFDKNVVWGVYEQDKTELIGLCGFLTNDEENREIGYRFRQQFWRKGYGTELAEQMINFCFQEFNLPLITADVWIENTGSVKILEKFFSPLREFKNETDNCIDRRYQLTRENWVKQNLD